MSIQFKINYEKFKITDKDILFFELVISQEKIPILKLNSDYELVTLYDINEQIPPEMIHYSMIPRCGRLDFNKEIEFHLYKVKEVKNTKSSAIQAKTFRLAYIRHIEEDSSSIQDVCEARVDNANGLQYLSFIYEFTKTNSKNRYTRKTEMNFNEGISGIVMSDTWLMQREFYSKSHFSCSYTLQSMDYNIIFKFIQQHEHDRLEHVKDLAVAFGNFVLGSIFEYGYDRHFKTGLTNADAGDVQIEVTGEGDCEDMSFFYMRLFRLLVSCQLNMGEGDFKKRVDELRDNYVVFAYLCDVKVEGEVLFHCTSLMISKNDNFDNISFEVTCPKQSYILNKENLKQFQRWHKASYVLMDNLWYGSFHHGASNELTPQSKLDEIEFKNY